MAMTSSSGAPPERERLLAAEIERLGRQLDVLEHQWKRKYWLALFGLLAIPAWLFVPSPMWAIATLMATPCLVLTQAYLIAMRRAECRELILHCRRDLESLQRARAA